MSEMIKNSDVEDVLFSIRRLVSDTPEAKPAPSEADDPKAEALFLTSSLRVNDPATEPEQIDLEDMTTDLSHFRDAVSREETEAAAMSSLEEFFAKSSDDQSPRRLHLSEVVNDEVAPVEEVPATDAETGELATRKWTDDPDVETLGEFATPDDTFGIPAADDAVREEAVVAEPSEIVAEDWMEAVSGETPKVDDPADEVTELEVAADSPKSETLDAAVTSDEITPDVDVDEDIETGAADGLANFDENILDEDALRDMVSEIVREELSGALGERITRNVRKLVRREIHRALMAREFD